MRVVAIETSGRLGSVALLESEHGAAHPVAERMTPEGQRTAQSLLPTLQALLGEHRWTAGDVDLVCVTTGPGSFTGLRIGIVAAKTFAYATGAGLVGVHTLAAMAQSAKQYSGDLIPKRLWAVLDAQRQELFAAQFDLGRSIVDQAQPATEIIGIGELLLRLTADDAITGPPMSKLSGRVTAAMLPQELWHPSAAAAGKLGVQLQARGAATDPLELIPHYYRKSAAEEKATRTSI